MGNTDKYLAVDIGASSGRHIVGSVEDGIMKLTEVYRFENGVHERNGHLCWDMDHLANSVIEGIKKAKETGVTPKSIGIDTWAVDFVLLDENDRIIGDTVAYRDNRTNGVREALEADGITFAECYHRTGIQFQKFNSIYQLAAIKRDHPEYLERAKHFLMIPDYLNFVLTGVKTNEYTNATSTGLVHAETRNWDYELIEKIGLPKEIFGEIKVPGTEVGPLKKEIAEYTGVEANEVMVVLPATHDTGSAYLAVPARDDEAVFLSSGTWSLLGVENMEAITSDASEAENFTNEGGYEYRFRYLKNIMGLWMFQNVKKEMEAKRGAKLGFTELIDGAKAMDLDVLVDVDDDRFLAPASMIDEVRKACAEKGVTLPEKDDAVTNVVFRSLAKDYQIAVEKLKNLTGKNYTSMNIVGGGCQNAYLNQLTANSTGLTVFAGPTEGTALGNLMVQFIRDGKYADLQAARDAIKKSFEIKEFQGE